MTRIARILPAILLAAAAVTAAQAQEETVNTISVREADAERQTGALRVPYTYAAVGLSHREYNDYGVNGFGVEGSYLLLPDFYAIAGFGMGRADDSASTRFTETELGAGYRRALSSVMDLNVALRLLKEDRSSDVAKRDDLGLQVDLGIRRVLWRQLEGSARISYFELQRYQSGHALPAASAFYPVLQRLSVGAEGVLGSSTFSYGLLGRWAF